jgi:hypothetical protein
MKKRIAILLALAMLVSLIGCTSKVVEEIRTTQPTLYADPTTTAPEGTTTTPTEPTEEELPPQIDQTDPPTTQPEPTEPQAPQQPEQSGGIPWWVLLIVGVVCLAGGVVAGIFVDKKTVLNLFKKKA